MYFATLNDLWQMNGHGPYVWSAYAIVVALLIGLVRTGVMRRRRVLERVRRRLRDAPATQPEG